ncbi:MAG TPA: hypothetical protein VNL14_17810 [Candidatus Acidoferrales bacterium]|nr:hypothetical protein [Candidatus Acidoferrales bacterium]
MRYLLIDRIIDWKEGQSMRGLKNVALSEDFLEHHFPKNPIMPGVLLLEALAQLAGWLEAASSRFENWFLLEKVERCLFYDFARPGDAVELQVALKSKAGAARSFTGTCTVGGKRRAAAEFSGSVMPLAELEDVDEQRRVFRLLSRTEGEP